MCVHVFRVMFAHVHVHRCVHPPPFGDECECYEDVLHAVVHAMRDLRSLQLVSFHNVVKTH